MTRLRPTLAFLMLAFVSIAACGGTAADPTTTSTTTTVAITTATTTTVPVSTTSTTSTTTTVAPLALIDHFDADAMMVEPFLFDPATDAVAIAITVPGEFTIVSGPGFEAPESGRQMLAWTYPGFAFGDVRVALTFRALQGVGDGVGYGVGLGGAEGEYIEVTVVPDASMLELKMVFGGEETIMDLPYDEAWYNPMGHNLLEVTLSQGTIVGSLNGTEIFSGPASGDKGPGPVYWFLGATAFNQGMGVDEFTATELP